MRNIKIAPAGTKLDFKFRIFAVALICLLSLARCKSVSESNAVRGAEGVTSLPTSTPSPTPTPTPRLVKALVSMGQSQTLNNQTGGTSSLALNPSTTLPAIAYLDKNHSAGGSGAAPALGALKYAFMDTYGTWNIEVIQLNYGTVACGTALSFCIGAPNAATAALFQAALIKLAFKADGTPVVAYVFGASAAGTGSKEIRVAERSTSGTWTITSAVAWPNVTGATAVSTSNVVIPITNLTLTVDPSDRLHITYILYTGTISNSSVRYLFRNSSLAWNDSIITSASAGAGTITVAGTQALQGGAAWCANSGGLVATHQYLSAAAGVGQPLLLVCSTVDATTGACTGWTSTNMTTGCTASTCSTTFATATNAGSRTDVTIEPATSKPIIAVYSTTGTLLYVVNPANLNACQTAQPTTANSWGALGQVDAATSGTNGISIQATSATNLLLAYNFGTTEQRVNRSTSGYNGWFGTGTTIEGSTAAAAAGEGIQLKYDSTNDVIYAVYARLPAATGTTFGNDIKVAYADPDVLVNSGAQGLFQTDWVDNTGNAFVPNTTNLPPLLSAARSSNDTIGYAYFFQDVTAASMKLYYGVRAGTASAPLFGERQVTSHQNGASLAAGVGLAPSLGFTGDSNPVIAAFNGTDVGLQVFRSWNGGMSFSATTVDDVVADVGRFPSLVVSGTTIAIAYRDETNTGLKFARWTPTGQWKKFSVDGLGGAGVCNAGNASGQYAKLALTSAGRPVIAFQDDTASPITVRLAVAAETVTSSTFTWTCVNVDGLAGNTRGEGIGLALDSSDKPHIAHFDQTSGMLRYVTSTSAVATAVAAGSGSFTGTDLANIGIPGVLGTGAYVPSVKVSSSDTVYVAYPNSNTGELVLASKESTASTFTYAAADSPPSGASVAQPILGQFASMFMNSNSLPTIFYRGYENWIRYVSYER